MHPHLGIISPTTNYPEKYDWLLVGVYPHCIPIRAHYFHGFFNHKPVHVAIPNFFRVEDDENPEKKSED